MSSSPVSWTYRPSTDDLALCPRAPGTLAQNPVRLPHASRKAPAEPRSTIEYRVVNSTKPHPHSPNRTRPSRRLKAAAGLPSKTVGYLLKTAEIGKYARRLRPRQTSSTESAGRSLGVNEPVGMITLSSRLMGSPSSWLGSCPSSRMSVRSGLIMGLGSLREIILRGTLRGRLVSASA